MRMAEFRVDLLLLTALMCCVLHPAEFSPGCCPPFYEAEGNCTETCPDQHYGNDSTRQCQPFPSDYTVLFNATAYYANISADTPLGTPIIHFQVVINNTYFNGEHLQVALALTRTPQVERIFKFENGENEEDIRGNWTTEMYPKIAFNRSVIYANDTPAGDYDFVLSVFINGGSTPVFVETTAFVTVSNAVDDCEGVECLNGTCVDGRLEFDCVCTPGYTGVYCESEINECQEVDCGNGDCIDLINNFTCACYPGWEGQYCSVGNFSCDKHLFEGDSGCTESCPSQHFGNYSSGKCQPFPSDYTVLFNATAYYANISADTPLGTPIIHFQVVINNTYFMSEHLQVALALTRTPQVERIFKFENGENEEDIRGNWTADVYPTIAFNRSVFYANETPASVPLPNDYDFVLSVFINGAGLPEYVETTAVVTVTNAVDDCEGVECLNGTCVDGRLEFDCVCTPGYTGVYCESEINECLEVDCGNGDCTDLINNFTCACYPGWEGQYCNVDIDYCESDLWPCDSEGTLYCEDGNATFTCHCNSGFGGRNCSYIDLCTQNPCRNGGTCNNEPGNTTSCTCSQGYTGELCESPLHTVCRPDYCMNNGTCQEREGSGELGSGVLCLCLPGFTGPQCDIPTLVPNSTSTMSATESLELTSVVVPSPETLPPASNSDEMVLPQVAVYSIAGFGGLVLVVIVSVLAVVGLSLRRKRRRNAIHRQSFDFSAFTVNPVAPAFPGKSTEGDNWSDLTNLHSQQDTMSQEMGSWDMKPGNMSRYEESSLVFKNPLAEQYRKTQ